MLINVCLLDHLAAAGALQMVLACLLNKGDGLLCDEYTYSHLVEAMMGPKGYVPVPVPMDDYGMTPEALEQVRQNRQLDQIAEGCHES